MTAPRYTESTWKGLPNFECTHCSFATLDRGQMVRHVRDRHPTDAELGGQTPGPLEGVRFASTEAQEAAIAAGLTVDDFATHSPTGKSGYVLSDVRAIAATAHQEG